MPKMPKTYLYLDGIRQLAKDAKGDEKIHIGIRPYEMHAGNMLAIVAYPILICEELQRQGKTPQIEIILSLNDWEQDALVGEDIYKYTFDVKPLDSTIQYSVMDNGEAVAPYWGKVIAEAVGEVSRRFPKVKVTPLFNSELRDYPAMKQVILKTIRQADELKKIMVEASGRPTNNQISCFASAVCPNCHHANTNTAIGLDDSVSIECEKCRHRATGQYQDFTYWLYHKPLFSARWKIFGFPLSLSGGDHFSEGDVEIRRKLYSFYFSQEPPVLDMIFSPTLLSSTNGQKMSKSRNNYYSIDLEKILTAARSCTDSTLEIDNV